MSLPLLGCKLAPLSKLKTFRQRVCWRISGLSMSTPYVFFENTLDNAKAAVSYRWLYHKPLNSQDYELFRPNINVRGIRSIFTEFRNLLVKTLHISVPRATPLDPLVFPNYYSGAKRRMYERAAIHYKAGFQPSAFLKSFIKREMLPTDPKKILIPRLISPRSPEYNVAVGVFIKALEVPIYHCIGKVFSEVGLSCVVTKGLNAVSTATAIFKAWGMFDSPVCVGLDASRFDQHITSPLLQWEHSIYESVYSGVDRLRLKALLKKQLRTKGFVTAGDGRIRFDLSAMRASGDMNTALGNCLLMCSMVFTYLRTKRIRVAVIDNGDDCLLILEKQDLDLLNDLPDYFWQNYNVVMKCEKDVDVLEKVEFCQSHPVCVDGEYRMVRNITNCFGKDTTVLHPNISMRNISAYLGTLSDGGLALCSGVPILQSLYKAYDRWSAGRRFTGYLEDTGASIMARGMVSDPRPISESSRVSFARAFGLWPNEQERFETEIDSFSFEPIIHPYCANMVY